MSQISIDPQLPALVTSFFRTTGINHSSLTNLSILAGVYDTYPGPTVQRNSQGVRPGFAVKVLSTAVSDPAQVATAWAGTACPTARGSSGGPGSHCFPHTDFNPELLTLVDTSVTPSVVKEVKLVEGEYYLLARVPYTTVTPAGHPMIDILLHLRPSGTTLNSHIVYFVRIDPAQTRYHHLCFFRAVAGLTPNSPITPARHDAPVLTTASATYDDGQTYAQIQADRERLRCTNRDEVMLHDAVTYAMRHTWTRSSESQSASGLCRNTPSNCVGTHQNLHPTGDAGHLDSLSRAGIRVVELAGLWGKDLRSLGSQGARASASVQALPTQSPAASVSFVGLRNNNDDREVHFGRESTRRVEAIIGTDVWKNIAIEATPNTDFRLFKRRYFEASFHRQWGKEATIQWLQGLAAFCLERSGEQVGIGDISHIVGEDITDHGSHERGVDVDIYGVEAPAAGSNYARGYWTEVSSGNVVFDRMGEPDPTAARPAYNTSGMTRLTGIDNDRVKAIWVNMLAYCAATHGLLSAVVWHGARRLRSDAVTAAQAAWDSVVAAGTGGSVPGWKASWGPGPATRADIQAPAGKFIGDGSGSGAYGSGGSWPPHQDHIHVRFR
ncbi:MAG: penicillin-insensitive murein endopeptidase [Myxococcota bacterium]